MIQVDIRPSSSAQVEGVDSKRQKPGEAADAKPRCHGAEHRPRHDEFRVSPLRWTTLLAVCLFGLCNGIVDETNSLLKVYVDTLGLELSEYVYACQLFFFMPLVFSAAGAALVDTLGLRAAIFTALLFASLRNCSGALLFATHVPGWPRLRLVYWISQRTFTSATLSLYYCLPLKLAESWFPEGERALALSLLLVLPSLGSACASLAYPHLAPDAAHAWPLSYVNLASAAVSIAGLALAVHRSSPNEGAPSERNWNSLNASGRRPAESLRASVGRVLANSDYLIQVTCLCALQTLLQTIQSILQDIFASSGLSQVFCGQFLAGTTIAAVALQLICSALIKPTPAGKTAAQLDPFRTRTCKLLMGVQCLTFVAASLTLILHELVPHSFVWLRKSQWWIMSVAFIGHILARSWAAPYFIEQAAELVSGSMSEAQASACSMVVASLLLNAFAVVFVHLRQVEARTKRALYGKSVLFECGAALGFTLLYLAKFGPSARRRKSSLSPASSSSARPSIASSTTTTTTTTTTGSDQP